MFTYVVTGEGRKSLPVHSDLNLLELQDLIRLQSQKLHPSGGGTVWKWGAEEFVNPRVQTLQDFGNFANALIGID